MTDKKLKIEFAPGCFDHFDGTQEELDQLMEEFTRLVETGEIHTQSRALTDEEFDNLSDEEKEIILEALAGLSDDSEPKQRKLQ